MNRAWAATAIAMLAILGACRGAVETTATNGTGGHGTGGQGTGGSGHGGDGAGGASTSTTGTTTGTGGATSSSSSSGATTSSSSSSGATTSSSSSSGGTTIDQACLALAAQRCQRLNMCSNVALITARWGDMTTCVTRNTLACMEGAAAPGTGATAPSTSACAAATQSELCVDLLDDNPGPACKPEAGARANGAACMFHAQCQSAFCLLPKGQACGTCQGEPAPGAPCTSAAECGANQTCSKTNVCETFLPLNAPCAQGAACQAGLACVGATNQTMGKCLHQAIGVGAACDAAKVTAADCDRNMGLYCNATSKTCEGLTWYAGGQSCGAVNGAVAGCLGGGQCIITTPPTGSCSAPAADGAACDDTHGPPCLPPARCVGGTCTLPDGAACP